MISKSEKKYSIIIPCRNGVKYLPTCVETIIRQNYDDYELIISDDHSVDNTVDYLQTLKLPNIKVVVPPEGLSMAEHWEWALKHASGEWLLFVGQDDGLQPYFFRLADKLTKIAVKKNVRTIMSQRAIFFWKGCEKIYGDTAVSYFAKPDVTLLSCKWQAILALLSFKVYFELPAMYTTSLFKKEIIKEAIVKQGGSLFVTHPQDANLAAIACSLEKRYVFSSIPLGWVGTSPKSAGMAVRCAASENTSVENESDLRELRNEYLQKINTSKLKMHPLAGNFQFGSSAIYFWGALLQTIKLRNGWFNRLIQSKLFKEVMFAGVLLDVKKNEKLRSKNRIQLFESIVNVNGCSMHVIEIVSKIMKIAYISKRVVLAVCRKLNKFSGKHILYQILWKQHPEITLISASACIDTIIQNNKLLEKI